MKKKGGRPRETGPKTEVGFHKLRSKTKKKIVGRHKVVQSAGVDVS